MSFVLVLKLYERRAKGSTILLLDAFMPSVSFVSLLHQSTFADAINRRFNVLGISHAETSHASLASRPALLYFQQNALHACLGENAGSLLPRITSSRCNMFFGHCSVDRLVTLAISGIAALTKEAKARRTPCCSLRFWVTLYNGTASACLRCSQIIEPCLMHVYPSSCLES